MIEMWRPVSDYAGLYEVSDEGRVRAVKSGKLLAPVANSSGYATVKLSAGGVSTRFRIHRLVCAAFHGPAPERFVAAHLDGSRTNNRAENLRWVSSAENAAHKQLHGTHQAGERHPRARLTREDVAAIRSSKARRTEIARQFGISQWTVKGIRAGTKWKSQAEGCQSGGAEGAASPTPSINQETPHAR